MRFVSTRDASRLTTLSITKLREWTNRRALIPADRLPKGRGISAQYTWQTILLLRIAVTLRNHFHIELQAHQGLFKSLRTALRGRSFVTLWDKTLLLRGSADWSIVDLADPEQMLSDTVIIHLNPHLLVLAEGFALSRPDIAGQLDFFPALPVATLAAGKTTQPLSNSQKRFA